MSHPPLLSVVLATYNDGDRVEETLNSYRQQRGVASGGLELIVVDGGSRDRSAEVLDRLARGLPQSKVISEPDRGVYDAMNKGWQSARGSFVQFLNAGDTYKDDTSAATVLEVLQQQQDALWLVFGAVHLYGGTKAPSVIPNLPHRVWRHALGLQPHCHQSTFFRRDVLALLGGYDERFDFVADFDLVFRCGLLSRPVEVHDVVVLYEGGGMSAQRSAEIPGLLSSVRKDRLQLDGFAAMIDERFTRYRRLRGAVAAKRPRGWLRS